MPSVDVRVLLGISSACSMSSCFMISSASIAWPGESEPGVAKYKRQAQSVEFGQWETFSHMSQRWSQNLLKDVIVLPVLVAGEKKLKTGEKMVPSRVVRGGLLAASTGTSNLPFGFMGLLLQVMVSNKKTKCQLFNKNKNYNL